VAKSKGSDGLRDLSLIRASGSTARVLNLALAYERHGESEEFKSNPLFRCAKLNRTLIIKHALRPHEHTLFDRPEPHTTKIVFPYSPTELELGGTSVMVGERRWEQLFRNAVGVNHSATDFEADFELLNVLHEAPSFDPFLLREQLRRIDRDPARCFFDISDADTAGMLKFVAAEIEPLTNLAFAASGRRAEKLSMRLAEKLMTDEGAQLLDPLRSALQMSDTQYREGVYAWKGFLYYRWLLRELNLRHEAFAASFKACRVSYSGRIKRAEIEGLRATVMARADLALWRSAEALHEYETAFAALSRSQAVAFRDFLLSAPGRFVALGEAIGSVEHMHSLWRFKFKGAAAPTAEADDLAPILEEFDRMLSGAELIRDGAQADLMLA
jgi:hypothetical protein